MARVFLSYDHEDVALAKPLVAALERAGHTVWYDRHIHGGAQYSSKIEQALDAADAVVVLWSPRSVESAWVRDEAAEGRNRGKLVPLSIAGIAPPMGFRQFQTIELGDWKGRGKVPHLAELLEAVESQAAAGDPTDGRPANPPLEASAPRAKSGASRPAGYRLWLAVAGAVALSAAGAWQFLRGPGLPVVQVTAANSSPQSRASASDLYVKLGSLAQIGKGKWQLVDADFPRGRPDLLFRTADLSDPRGVRANLVLLDGKDMALLWSREFAFPAGSEADLRQQLSLTAGRVLECALESRGAGGLKRDAQKLFLTTCASIAELSISNYDSVITGLRAVLKDNPKFVPALSRLLMADLTALDFASLDPQGARAARAALERDLEVARRIAPDLPAAVVAQASLLPRDAYDRLFGLFEAAVEAHPDDPLLLAEQGVLLQRVGYMERGAELARRVAALDPLSPAATSNMIMAQAYAGRLEDARRELAKAERTWAGTGALRDAQWGFHLRFGDATVAMKLVDPQITGAHIYLRARADPSPANVARLLDFLRKFESTSPPGDWSWGVQAFTEFGAIEDSFRWLAKESREHIALDSYILFRPGLANLRRDPRFRALAERIGLLDFWRKSGRWPDFCNDTSLPYDCRTGAARDGG